MAPADLEARRRALTAWANALAEQIQKRLPERSRSEELRELDAFFRSQFARLR